MTLNWQPFSSLLPEVHAGRLAILLTLPLADLLGSAFIDKAALYRQELFLVLRLHLTSHDSQLRADKILQYREKCLLECDLYLNFLLIHDFISKHVFL